MLTNYKNCSICAIRLLRIQHLMYLRSSKTSMIYSSTTFNSNSKLMYTTIFKDTKITKKNFSGRGVENMCEDLQNSTLSPLEAFGRWASFVFTGDECFDASYASRIAERSNTSWNQPGTLSGSKQKVISRNYATLSRISLQGVNGIIFNAHKQDYSKLQMIGLGFQIMLT